MTQWVFSVSRWTDRDECCFPATFPAQVESITLTMADIQESLLSPTTMPAYGVNSTGTSRTGFTARMSVAVV
ncbi:hypothetical protein [Escherichia coli]|uniref:hypothetical protein n=1 Tax=Escherichia coli TaxID=562 RepID=UPI003D9C3BE0